MDRYSNCIFCGQIIRWHLVWNDKKKKEQWIPRNEDGTTHVETGMSISAGKRRIKAVANLNKRVKQAKEKKEAWKRKHGFS